MAKLIAELVKEEFYYVLKREKIDVVVSVPVSRKRKNERGYNQVDEILNFLKVNYVQIERIKNTKKMAGILNEEDRNKNIKGAFKISGNIDFKNSILEQFDNGENTSNIRITVFCLAAAREIKMNRGEI